ncbi:MAG: HD-GYP domain-containing protein [Bacillota bacterium]
MLLLNPHTQFLEYSAWRGFKTALPEKTGVRLGEEYAGQVALSQRLLFAAIPTEARSSSPQVKALATEGFSSYLGAPLTAKGKVVGVLEVLSRQVLSPNRSWIEFLETFARQTAIAIDNMVMFEQVQRSHNELIAAYEATIEGWAYALDLRDRETEGHSRRVTEITVRLARKMGMREDELVHVRRGALLHDIGKLGVPDSILLKPGRLSEEEWQIMRKHPQFARDMLWSISYLRPALDIPYCHHERWDGTGYPRGLRGEEIPLAARIFAVVDVWDALSSDRPYRSAWPREQVRDYILKQSGKHFDPRVVSLFLKELDQL